MDEDTRLTQADALLNGMRAKLAGLLSAADVSALILEVQGEIAELDRLSGVAAAEVAHHTVPTAVAMDPARNGTSYTFAARRFRELLQALSTRRKAEEDAEAQAECRKVFEAATEDRDAAVTALRTEYPKLARRLTDLVAQIAEADRIVTAANTKAPRGSERLQAVEAAAGTKVLPLLNLPDLDGTVMAEMDHEEMGRLQTERFQSLQRSAYASAQPFGTSAAFEASVARMKAANAAADEISKRRIGGRAA